MNTPQSQDQTAARIDQNHTGNLSSAPDQAVLSSGELSWPGSHPQAVPVFHIPQGVEISAIPGKGRGVVARVTFLPGEIIETCPMLLQPDTPPVKMCLGGEPGHFRFDDLEDYFFAWGQDRVALALGLGGLYNHATNPNARNIKHLDSARMTIQAVRKILPGQEITISYREVWFELRD